MKESSTNKELDQNTEAKIKNAARSLFHLNGFAATRTRDIAEEAGINLALLNYYFRSKHKLFEIIMMETLQDFFQSMRVVFNDHTTTLDQKVEQIAERYIDMLMTNPHIPIFLLNELRNNSTEFIEKINMKDMIMGSVFFKQVNEAMGKSLAPLHPLQFMMNLMSLVMFPFVGSPVLRIMGELNTEQFNEMMTVRKALIPRWIKQMMNT